MKVPTYIQGRRYTTRRLGGGGREPFEVDSFHATPIGKMLNAEKFAGDQSPGAAANGYINDRGG